MEISGIIGKQIRIEHGGSSVQVHSTRIQKAPDDKVCDTNDIQTGECNSNPSQNIQSKCSKLSATLSPNTDVQSNMSDSTPETMNVDGRPKVRGVDQGQGNLDSNPDAMNFETLQSLGGNPQERECNWMTIQMRWTVDHHKHSVLWVSQKEFWKGGSIEKQSIKFSKDIGWMLNE